MPLSIKRGPAGAALKIACKLKGDVGRSPLARGTTPARHLIEAHAKAWYGMAWHKTSRYHSLKQLRHQATPLFRAPLAHIRPLISDPLFLERRTCPESDVVTSTLFRISPSDHPATPSPASSRSIPDTPLYLQQELPLLLLLLLLFDFSFSVQPSFDLPDHVLP